MFLLVLNRGVTIMAVKRKRRRPAKKGWKRLFVYEATGLVLFALTCIGMARTGIAGKVLVDIARFFAGEWYIVIFIGTLFLSIYYIWVRKQPRFFTRRLVGFYILFLAMLLLSHVKLFEALTDNNQWHNASVLRNTWELYHEYLLGNIAVGYLGGGMIGAISFAFFYVLFAAKGAMFMALCLILISIILITGKSLRDTVGKLMTHLGHLSRSARENAMDKWQESRESRRNKQEERAQRQSVELVDQDAVMEEGSEPIIHDFNEGADPAYDTANKITTGLEEQEEPEDKTSFLVPEMENEAYQLPSFDLLHPPVKNAQTNERQHIASNVRKLEQTFESFGVKAKVKKVHLGPAVTKYEVYPDVGVKVSRIVNLNDDIALALAAKEIRIEAPIPGKSAVGIEVPNKEVATVSLREVLESEYSSKEMSKLAIGLGRDISGVPILADLSKMPHLLVAGATGSGKSVCINGIITSLLMRTKPHEVKLLMVDPKMVELNVYNGVPHLLTPVVTNPRMASQALKKVVDEMERRYELFSHSGTRNLQGYNHYVQKQNELREEQQPYMPYIVVIIDELADLMMIASKDVEDAITRLAQMARAAGIHLIIATQRPSVDVITGVIKANIPSRIAFSVSSQTDSRTILDSGGAEKLLGKGDMLFLPIGASKPTRIQGAFLSEDEVESVVDFVISQQQAQYQENMIPTEESEQKAQEIQDDLFADAVKLVVDMQTASVSMLQRRFRIGYARAARLIDAMEERRIVGPYEGSRPREVLITKIEDEISS